MARALSLRGDWKAGLAGGCPKFETYGNNPQFIIAPSQAGAFTIELTQPTDAPARLPIGFVVLNRDPTQPVKPKLSSKRLVAKTNYKATLSRSLTINLEPAAAGKAYVLLVSTFDPDQYGSFTVTVTSEDDPAFTLSPVAVTPGVAASGSLAAAGGDGVPPAAAKLPVAPPAPPLGRLKPSDDPTLSAALSAIRAAATGAFDDDDFKVKLKVEAGQPKDKSINGRVLYLQVSPRDLPASPRDLPVSPPMCMHLLSLRVLPLTPRPPLVYACPGPPRAYLRQGGRIPSAVRDGGAWADWRRVSDHLPTSPARLVAPRRDLDCEHAQGPARAAHRIPR